MLDYLLVISIHVYLLLLFTLAYKALYFSFISLVVTVCLAISAQTLFLQFHYKIIFPTVRDLSALQFIHFFISTCHQALFFYFIPHYIYTCFILLYFIFISLPVTFSVFIQTDKQRKKQNKQTEKKTYRNITNHNRRNIDWITLKQNKHNHSKNTHVIIDRQIAFIVP